MARAPVADRFPFSLLTAGKTFEDYAANRATRDVAERNLERVPDAPRHIPGKNEGSAQGHRLAGARLC